MGNVGRGKLAVLIPVGSQCEQIKFLIKKLQPTVVGLIFTDTEPSKKAKEDLLRYMRDNQLCITIYERVIEDRHEEISKQIVCLEELYEEIVKNHQDVVSQIKVDITGGRKWMSTAMTLFAYIKNLEMLYVQVKYTRDGKIIPGTEQMYSIWPYVVWPLQMKEADSFFKSGNYSRAEEIYNVLKDVVSDKDVLLDIRSRWFKSRVCNLLYEFNISLVYDTLLDYDRFLSLNRYYEFKDDLQELIHPWVNVLKEFDEYDNKTKISYLSDEKYFRAVFILLELCGKLAMKKKDYEKGILLAYRKAELTVQSILSVYGINVKEGISEELREKYNSAFSEINMHVYETFSDIPKSPIGFLVGLEILLAIKELGNDIHNRINIERSALKRIRNEVEKRNLLWIEHGFKCASLDDLNNFEKFIKKEVLSNLIGDKNLGKYIADSKKILRFLTG